MKDIYSSNTDFKNYVDKYCRTYRYTLEEALEHDFVKGIAHQYTHPNDTYTFGNVGPLRPLTNGDRIRAMSDEDLAEFIKQAVYCGGLLNESQSSELCKNCAKPFCVDIFRWLKTEVT